MNLLDMQGLDAARDTSDGERTISIISIFSGYQLICLD
jgi:hypothetical protein